MCAGWLADKGPVPVRGEIVWLITRHICCTINLADKVVLKDTDGQGRVSYEVVPVTARGHDILQDDTALPSSAKL